MGYDKEDVLNNLTFQSVIDFLEDNGAEPIADMEKKTLTARTICHNPSCCGSRKLWYDHNRKSFHCFTDCGDSFNIFELVKRIKYVRQEQIPAKTNEGVEYLHDYKFPDCVNLLGDFLGIEERHISLNINSFSFKSPSWDILNEYKKINEIHLNEDILLQKVLPKKKDYIRNYPITHFQNWIEEGITFESILKFNIRFDPIQYAAIIPHYDVNGNLVGIRQRTFIKDNEEFGKYRPSLSFEDSAHPLGYNLYGLNHTKENIKKVKAAIVFEGEKSVLIYDSIFGSENNISVATCGCTISLYQIMLLIACGAEEIIIAYDKQFKKIGDEEYLRWIKKLAKIKKKYSHLAKITFIFDKFGNILNYKSSPIDEGKAKYNKLFAERR